METYLLDVVVPWADAHLATIADPEDRLIGGMSAGAYCAVDQGLRHQDVFSTILGIVPYVEPGAGGRRMLSTSAQYDAHDVARYLPTLVLPRPVAVFVDVPGRELASPEAAQAATLVRLLTARARRSSTAPNRTSSTPGRWPAPPCPRARVRLRAPAGALSPHQVARAGRPRSSRTTAHPRRAAARLTLPSVHLVVQRCRHGEPVTDDR